MPGTSNIIYSLFYLDLICGFTIEKCINHLHHNIPSRKIYKSYLPISGKAEQCSDDITTSI